MSGEPVTKKKQGNPKAKILVNSERKFLIDIYKLTTTYCTNILMCCLYISTHTSILCAFCVSPSVHLS